MRCRAESSRIAFKGLIEGKGKKFSAPCFCLLQHNGQTMFPEGRRQCLKLNPRRNPKSENCEVTSRPEALFPITTNMYKKTKEQG